LGKPAAKRPKWGPRVPNSADQVKPGPAAKKRQNLLLTRKKEFRTIPGGKK
jgi:hypothetical protein